VSKVDTSKWVEDGTGRSGGDIPTPYATLAGASAGSFFVPGSAVRATYIAGAVVQDGRSRIDTDFRATHDFEALGLGPYDAVEMGPNTDGNHMRSNGSATAEGTLSSTTSGGHERVILDVTAFQCSLGGQTRTMVVRGRAINNNIDRTEVDTGTGLSPYKHFRVGLTLQLQMADGNVTVDVPMWDVLLVSKLHADRNNVPVERSDVIMVGEDEYLVAKDNTKRMIDRVASSIEVHASAWDSPVVLDAWPIHEVYSIATYIGYL